jgi:NIMA-interacting peptidyl-prolyl cis-trans isomerase 1
MKMKPVLFASLGALALAQIGCGALTSSPDWIGGGLAVEAPRGHAEEDRVAEVERARIAAQPTEIGARHVLIMSVDSKQKPDSIVRSRAEAKKRAEMILAKIRAGANFEAMVKEYTDEPGGAERNGDLGVFERTAMVKAFSEAAFSLQKGEVSNIIETQFGFHIIKRTE